MDTSQREAELERALRLVCDASSHMYARMLLAQFASKELGRDERVIELEQEFLTPFEQAIDVARSALRLHPGEDF